MKLFEIVTANQANIDTDQIYPARFLLTTLRQGLGMYLFHDDPSLQIKASVNEKVLIAGDNFGCGSSREHAVWALMDVGIKGIIAPSFGEIFRINCLKNGILAIVLDEAKCFELTHLNPRRIFIDLTHKTINHPNLECMHFDLDSFSHQCLKQGYDQLDYLISHSHAIEQYEHNNQRN